MNLANFFDLNVLYGGLFLGVSTVRCTGVAGALLLRLFGERSQIAAWAEGSTAGNAAAIFWPRISIPGVIAGCACVCVCM